MGCQEDFILSVKDGAIAGWKEYGVLPSLTIAQAILESDWGRSELATEANNLFGIKGAYEGESYLVPTKEWDGEKFITINAEFAKYPAKDVSVKEHGAFFASTPFREDNYKHLIGETNPRKAVESILQPVANSSYATDPNYADKIMNIINEHNLAQYDVVDYNIVDLKDTTFTIDGKDYKLEEISQDDNQIEGEEK